MKRNKKGILTDLVTVYVCCEKSHSAAPPGLHSLVYMLDAPSHMILICHSKQQYRNEHRVCRFVCLFG